MGLIRPGREVKGHRRPGGHRGDVGLRYPGLDGQPAIIDYDCKYLTAIDRLMLAGGEDHAAGARRAQGQCVYGRTGGRQCLFVICQLSQSSLDGKRFPAREGGAIVPGFLELMRRPGQRQGQLGIDQAGKQLA